MNAGIAPSHQPDPKIVGRLLTVQNACLVMAGTIAGLILSGWLVPAVGSALPGGWSLMKSNTALAVLLSVAGLFLTQPKRSGRQILGGRICAVSVLVLAGAALLGHLTGLTSWFDTLVAADSSAELPGRMSMQTASFFVLLGLTLTIAGEGNKVRRQAADALTLALLAMILMVLGGYWFGAAKLFGQSAQIRTSPQTLVCMALLGLAAGVHATRAGFFSVFAGIGIGSQTARRALPFILLLPIALIRIGAYSVTEGWLSVAYGAAMTAAITATLFFSFNALLGGRINELERDLRNTSLTDELTQVHNRRGFYLLGEHTLREGRRAATPLTVLYFDLDGLKKVNDTLGHDAGSQLLREFANLLRANFRDSDVVARVGGDEFAVVTHNGQAGSLTALRRLEDATAAANSTSSKPYRVSYSVGEALSEPASSESFADLVTRADALMYSRKRNKKKSTRMAESPA